MSRERRHPSHRAPGWAGGSLVRYGPMSSAARQHEARRHRIAAPRSHRVPAQQRSNDAGNGSALYEKANTHSPRCQMLAHAVRFLGFQTPTPGQRELRRVPPTWRGDQQRQTSGNPLTCKTSTVLPAWMEFLRRQIARGLCDATVAHKRSMRPRCCDEAVVVIFGRPASGAAQHRRRSVTGSLHSSYGRPTWHYRLRAAMRGNPSSVARHGAGPLSTGSCLGCIVPSLGRDGVTQRWL